MASKEPSNNTNNNNDNNKSISLGTVVKGLGDLYINTNNNDSKIDNNGNNEINNNNIDDNSRNDNNNNTYYKNDNNNNSNNENDYCYDSVPTTPVSFSSVSSSGPSSPTDKSSFLISSDNNKARILLITEILEHILIFVPEPNNLALVCRQFHNIVLTSPGFKRRWLRFWLNPRLPDAFLPKYSDLCKAVKTKTPFHILIQVVDLIKLYRKTLASSIDGSITKLFEYANQHEENYLLIPYLIHKGLKVERYVKDSCYEDVLLTEEGSEPDRKSQKDYLSNLIIPATRSKEFRNQLANSMNFFQDTDLAFSIVLHERLDVADLLALHQKHTLDILEESVDRQYTEGIAWAFGRGVGELQKRNPLYLRLCIEKADIESTKKVIQSGACIDTSPSNHSNYLSSYGSTSLLEFSIQCYWTYRDDEKNINSRREIIELFLKSGADPNAGDGRPLSLCLTHRDWMLTRLLMDYGADTNCEEMISVRNANLLIKKSEKCFLDRKWTRKLNPKRLSIRRYIHK